jgi:hypothetical protein
MIKDIHPELKKLQNLYSWSTFYQSNRMQEDYDKVQKQIVAQQSKFKKGNNAPQSK